MKGSLLCAIVALFALQVQVMAQVEDSREPGEDKEMQREVPNPEKIAQKETDRLTAALNLTEKQSKKVYKLLLKDQREMFENRMPPMMMGGNRPDGIEMGMQRPPMRGNDGAEMGMQRPPMGGNRSMEENQEEMKKQIEKKNKKMKKILTDSQYNQWLGMSQKSMPERGKGPQRQEGKEE